MACDVLDHWMLTLVLFEHPGAHCKQLYPYVEYILSSPPVLMNLVLMGPFSWCIQRISSDQPFHYSVCLQTYTMFYFLSVYSHFIVSQFPLHVF